MCRLSVSRRGRSCLVREARFGAARWVSRSPPCLEGDKAGEVSLAPGRPRRVGAGLWGWMGTGKGAGGGWTQLQWAENTGARS